jgi:hypothetical protein
MKKSKLRAGVSLPVAALAALLGFSATTGVAMVSTPAQAQTTLSPMQISKIRSSLVFAIGAAHGNDAVISAAIADAVSNILAQYGYDAAGSVTSAVIATAEQMGVSGDAVGKGLAQTAARIAASRYCDPLAYRANYCTRVGQSIALALANDGKVTEIAAFQSASMSLGQTQLASLAGRGSTPTGDTGTTGALFNYSTAPFAVTTGGLIPGYRQSNVVSASAAHR